MGKMAFDFEIGKYLSSILLFALVSIGLFECRGITALEVESIERDEVLSDVFRVKWKADLVQKNVTFEVTARTLGYVGLGISSNGNMKGSDIVIGGVGADGTPYFEDRHGTGYVTPELDALQDWTLISARQNGSHTTLSFWRRLETCDDHDVEITKDTQYLIWAVGRSDNLEHHGDRGAKALNLLDPPSPPIDVSKLKQFRIPVNSAVSSVKDTVYWCTAHKAPRVTKKIQIIGFEVILESETALRYTHHLILHKCTGPNLAEVIQPFLNQPGGECYNPTDPIYSLYEHCNTYFYVWAKGGDRLLLPEHIGLPFGENTGQDEYYLVEVHYDNPNLDKNVHYETGVTVFYTSGDGLRPNDGGLLHIGHQVRPSLTVPPNMKEFTIVGHCSTECTKAAFPSTGLKIFNTLLHSHLNGRKLKLRHFRDGKELPWIAYDNNYDFNYQQNRALTKEVTILPGDHISYECTYDTTWENPPSATHGGLSTRHEMCETFVLYYPLVKTIDVCHSVVATFEELLKQFGIDEMKMRDSDTPVVLAPPSLANLTYEQVLNTKVKWTPQLLQDVQNRLRYSDHTGSCNTHSNGQDGKRLTVHSGLTTYPKLTHVYEPPALCSSESSKTISFVTLNLVSLILCQALW